MNFTREPIIETIISAKDGYKLALKSTKTSQGEEYLVDAVEVVSFGGSFFYRCQERPKTFFIPANDFEVLEVKETRILIKNPTSDRSLKIAGGKESSKQQKPEEQLPEDQKRDKKRGRRTRTKLTSDAVSKTPSNEAPKSVEKGKTALSPPPIPQELNQDKKPTVFSHLLIPPSGLISESLHKYKQEEQAPKTLAIKEEKPLRQTTVKKIKPKSEEVTKEKETPSKEKLEAPMVKETDRSESSKPCETLQEKEVSAEELVKVTTDKDTK